MKKAILFILIADSFCCNAQVDVSFDYNHFEQQILSYEPIQKSSVSKKDFDYGLMILKETKAVTKNNPKNFNLADYFNILSAVLTLKEKETNLKIAFEKFKNAKGSCEYFVAFENTVRNNTKFDFIRSDYNKKLAECNASLIANVQIDIKAYCDSNNLDYALVKKIAQIDLDDQIYRNQMPLDVRQEELDHKNQKMINDLYHSYKTYLGSSLVGKKFESVMWSVIQHSNLEMMERYLPIIQQAVTEKQLNLGVFKMLIDRYYGLKYGYQIFGSQHDLSFPIAEEKKRSEISLKYGIQ